MSVWSCNAKPLACPVTLASYLTSLGLGFLLIECGFIYPASSPPLSLFGGPPPQDWRYRNRGYRIRSCFGSLSRSRGVRSWLQFCELELWIWDRISWNLFPWEWWQPLYSTQTWWQYLAPETLGGLCPVCVCVCVLLRDILVFYPSCFYGECPL